MPYTERLNIFVWKEPDACLKEEVIHFIKDTQPTNKEIVILHCDEACAVDSSIPLIFYLYTKCQQFKIFQNEKLMFLNSKDFCQATELCLTRLKSQEEELVCESVIECHKEYRKVLEEMDENTMHKSASKLKEFVTKNNCIDIWQMLTGFQKYKSVNQEFSKHVSELKFLILGTINNYIFKEIMSFLNCETILSITIETPLNVSLQESPSSQPSHTITTEPIKVDEFCTDTEKFQYLESATEEYCKEIMTAFLSLLINSRNELALSKVMISPFINLSHEAFTHLKHLAVEKEMPMCQTAISYVTKVRLGGKGYAPPQDCPMLPHLKCLELFVDTLNNLQTIMEEDLSPKSSLKKLINVLKKKLLKCESGKLKKCAVEKVSMKLHSVTDRVLELAKSQGSSGGPQICQETLDILHYLVNYINCSCVVFDPEQIMRQRHCKRTPINLPPLLGYFRSPEEESTCEENSVINEDSIASNDSSIGYPPPFMSYFHNSDNSCSVVSTVSCTDISTPIKTNFKDCIEKQESVDKDGVLGNSKSTTHPTNNRKRPILSDIANVEAKNSEKKAKAETGKLALKMKETCNKKIPKKAVKKTNLSKKFKLIEGQGKITSFFSTSQK